MFPQDVEKVPRLRFKEFSGEWGNKTLADYLSIPTLKSIDVSDANQIISVKLNLKGVTRISSDSTLKLGSTKYYERKKGQFIYGKQNFFNGSMALIPEEFDGLVSSGDVPSFDVKNINPLFLYDFVSRRDYYKRSEQKANGTGSKRIHEKTLLEFPISVPSEKEQKVIVKFFQSINSTEDYEKKLLDNLIKTKKFYLQKMFI